ncbi:MAG: cytochrome P450 [Caldilineaceae bacterium]
MAAEAQGERLSEEELSSMVALLFVTGHETVVNLLGNGALVLMQHPEQLACLLADNSDAAWDAAVEELLRFDGPVETSTTRGRARTSPCTAAEIKRGDVVRVVITSANRDERQFACPHQLDLQRDDVNAHLAFGRGAHYCLGAPLARLEGRIALRSCSRLAVLAADVTAQNSPGASASSSAAGCAAHRAVKRIGSGV